MRPTLAPPNERAARRARARGGEPDPIRQERRGSESGEPSGTAVFEPARRKQ